MPEYKTSREKRKADPYLYRRSGVDRRKTYDFDNFTEGGMERRDEKERRKDCVKVSKWSSLCPKDESENTGHYHK